MTEGWDHTADTERQMEAVFKCGKENVEEVLTAVCRLKSVIEEIEAVLNCACLKRQKQQELVPTN